MLLKILLTISVIAGAVLYLRMRRPPLESDAQTPRSIPARKSDKRDTLIKSAAAGLAVLMLAGAGAYLYHQWQDSYRVVTVKVIDTRSGQVAEYEAYKGDVEGRQLVTTDGRTVTLAEVERMELGGK